MKVFLTGYWDYPNDRGDNPLGFPFSRIGYMPLVGWALAEDSIPSVSIRVDGKVFLEAKPVHRREDVEALFFQHLTDSRPTGWATSIDISQLVPGEHEISIVARAGGSVADFGWRKFSVPSLPRYSDFLSTLTPLLRCPDTGGPMVFNEGALASGANPARRYPVLNGHIYLGGGEAGSWTTHPTSAISLSHYGHELLRTASGPILMLGAGLTDTYPNVIQLDLFDYPSIDIVTGGGDLPFQDGVLSGVICENVIEHVPNPFSLIKEIQRVLRPGGLLSLVGTNMYFTHGFPSHYFNPTRYGMQHLLEEVCHFEGIYETCDIAASLHSVVSHYYYSLEPTARKIVGNLSVSDFIQHLANPQGHIAEALRAISPVLQDAMSKNVMFFGAKK